MCFIKRRIDLKIADNDIQVYKVILKTNEGLKSFYEEFEYEIGKTYEGNIEIGHELFGEFVSVAFHSYGRHCQYDLDNRHINVHYPFSNRGLYLDSYDRFYKLSDSNVEEAVIALCIIPKGSRYDYNEKGEYISDKIKIRKILNMESNVNENQI